jgi:hypothetical protein
MSNTNMAIDRHVSTRIMSSQDPIVRTPLVGATLAQLYPEAAERNSIDGDNHDAGGFRLTACCCASLRLMSATRKRMTPRVFIPSYHHQHSCEQHSSEKTGGEYTEGETYCFEGGTEIIKWSDD